MPAQLSRFAVELQRASEIPKLLVEPAETVGDPANVEVALALPGLGQRAIEHRTRFGIETTADVGQAEAPQPETLVELVVDGLRLSRHPALDLDRPVEVALPVVEVAEEEEPVQVQIGGAEWLAEAYRLLQQRGRLVQLSVAAVHRATGGQSLGQDPVVARSEDHTSELQSHSDIGCRI